MSLFEALLKVQGSLGAIAKDEKNPFFKSNYLSLNGLRDALVPVLTANGLVITQPTVYQDGKQFVKTTVTHAKTKEELIGLNEVIVKNSGDAQQAGSGISYARRYGIMSLLCLAAEDDDGNSSSGKIVAARLTPTAPAIIAKAEAGTPAPAPTQVVVETKKKVSFSKKAVTATTTEDEL
jgi:hypothetical protein